MKEKLDAINKKDAKKESAAKLKEKLKEVGEEGSDSDGSQVETSDLQSILQDAIKRSMTRIRN